MSVLEKEMKVFLERVDAAVPGAVGDFNAYRSSTALNIKTNMEVSVLPTFAFG